MKLISSELRLAYRQLLQWVGLLGLTVHRPLRGLAQPRRLPLQRIPDSGTTAWHRALQPQQRRGHGLCLVTSARCG